MKNGSEATLDGPERIYADVSIDERAGGWRILLDGKPVLTPRRAELAVPARGLAEALADEWRQQDERIDPRSMPLTKLANTALDAVAPDMDAVMAGILGFAGRDLLCYRAVSPRDLTERQRLAWDPLLQWADSQYGARLVVTEGVMPVEQPRASLAALGAACSALDSFGLTALHVMTTLTGSAILALAHSAGRLSLDDAWAAAHLDEDYQARHWGEDYEAKRRRETRFAEMRAASDFYRLSRNS